MQAFPRFALQLVAMLPLRALHALGGVLGWAMYGISPTYRRHLRENLSRAGYREATLRREAIASAGRMLLELPAIWLRPRDEVLAWVKRVEGESLLDAARERGRGLVLLTPHQGCFELLAQFAASRFPITVLYRAPKLEWLRPVLERGRAGANLRLARADLGGVRELVAALRRGEAVGILPDQVPGRGEGEWASFFGHPAYTMTLAAKLAARPGVEAFIAFGERLPRGAGYAVHVRPLPPPRPDESPVRRVNRAVEDLVRECPAQYLWAYNRYKTPRGARPAP